jgi:hypothetical protein
MEAPNPDAPRIATEARQVAQAIEQRLKKLEAAGYDATDVRARTLSLAREHKRMGQNWDSAAQWYLAIAAMNAALDDQRLQPALTEVANALRFPAGSGHSYDSPRDFQPRGKVEQAFGDLVKELEKAKK